MLEGALGGCLSRHLRKLRPRATRLLAQLTDEETEAQAGGATGHSPEARFTPEAVLKPWAPGFSARPLDERRGLRAPPCKGLQDAV